MRVGVRVSVSVMVGARVRLGASVRVGTMARVKVGTSVRVGVRTRARVGAGVGGGGFPSRHGVCVDTSPVAASAHGFPVQTWGMRGHQLRRRQRPWLSRPDMGYVVALPDAGWRRLGGGKRG